MGLLNILFYDDKKRYVLTESGSLFEMNPRSRAELKNNPNKRVYVSEYSKGEKLAKGTETYLAEEELHSCLDKGKKYVIYEASVLRDPDNRYDEASWDYGFIYTVFEGKSVMEACNDIKKREMNLKMSAKGKIILPYYEPDVVKQKYIDYYIWHGKGEPGDMPKLACRLASAMAMIIYKSNPKGMKNITKQDIIDFYDKAKNTKGVSGEYGLGNNVAILAEQYDKKLNFDLGPEINVDKDTIIKELKKGNPVFASFAYHTEVIYGYDEDDDVFLVDDVGYQGDVKIDPNDNWYGTTTIGLPTFEYQSVERRSLKTIRCIV